MSQHVEPSMDSYIVILRVPQGIPESELKLRLEATLREHESVFIYRARIVDVKRIKV